METYAQRRAARVFRGCDRIVGAGPRCRIVWPGPLSPEGTPIDIREGRYRRERQRACYELKHGLTRPSDRVVATCGNDRCLDQRHLRAIPAPKPPKPPKAPRPSRARAATAPAVLDAPTDHFTPSAASL